MNITSHSSLQNGKLLAERDGVKRRTEELAMEKDALKVLPLPSTFDNSPPPRAIFTISSLSHRGLVTAGNLHQAVRFPELPGNLAESPVHVADIQSPGGRLRRGIGSGQDRWTDSFLGSGSSMSVNASFASETPTSLR